MSLHEGAVRRYIDRSEPWTVVERGDTYNIHAGRRCIARVQKKIGAEADAALIVHAVNRLLAIYALEELKDAVTEHP